MKCAILRDLMRAIANCDAATPEQRARAETLALYFDPDLLFGHLFA